MSDCAECEDGEIDMYDEDPINATPGEFRMCGACMGYGIVRWCPSCGLDITLYVAANEEDDYHIGDGRSEYA